MKILTNISWSKQEDEVILLNNRTGYGLQLDEIGMKIWTKVQECDTLNDIINSLVSEFGEDNRDAIAKDTTELVELLIEQKIIEKSC